jgi:hypothetical protein
MKAKTLLIAAAALAAGVMHSQAQVYSQNIVGYINVPLNTGYNLIANQLDVDGTGTNNSIYTAVGTNFPANTQILAWNPSSAAFTSTKLLSSGKWSANNLVVTNAMNPGSGFFINVAAPTNITFVGNVITGTNTYPLIAGFQIVAPSGPIGGMIDTNNGYTPSHNDQILVWNNSSASYTSHKWLTSSWSAGDPVLTVGQSIFLNAVNNTNWTQVLNVQ